MTCIVQQCALCFRNAMYSGNRTCTSAWATQWVRDRARRSAQTAHRKVKAADWLWKKEKQSFCIYVVLTSEKDWLIRMSLMEARLQWKNTRASGEELFKQCSVQLKMQTFICQPLCPSASCLMEYIWVQWPCDRTTGKQFGIITSASLMDWSISNVKLSHSDYRDLDLHVRTFCT